MSHSSLNRWLIRTVVLSTGGALGLACLVLLGHEVTSLRASIEQEATTLAQVVGVNCAVPLSFDDGEAVRETLASVSAAGHIMEAVVYDHEGKIFAQFLPDGQEPLAPPSARPDGTRVTDGALQVIRPILFDGTRIGTILLRRDRAELTRLTSRFVLLIGGLLALVGVLVVWVASRLRRHISRPLADLARGSAIIAAGDLTAPSPEFRDDEIGLLARDFDDMRRGLRDLVGQVRHGISDVSLVAQAMEVSGGLLDEEVTRQRQAIGETTDSLQQVGTSIGEMNANIEQMARSARSTSVSILEIDDSFGSVVERMNTQSGSIETTLEAVGGLVGSIGEIGTAVGALHQATQGALGRLEQLGDAVGNIRHNAEATHELSADTSAEAERGLQAVTETVNAMSGIATSFEQVRENVVRLAERSSSIDQIVGVIGDFTEQTNLLSLNASIIAAQAGEQGRAFSVVADEVNSLAERTKRSATEIAKLIAEVAEDTRAAVAAVGHGSSRVKEGVERSRFAGEVLRRISEKSNGSTERVHEIVGATVHQGENLTAVDAAMREVKARVDAIRQATSNQQQETSKITQASEEIRLLGEGVQQSTEEQRQRGQRINRAVTEVATTIDQIAEATHAQTRSSGTIHEALEVFQGVSAETRRRAAALGEMVSRLSERSRQLEDEIGRFKIDP